MQNWAPNAVRLSIAVPLFLLLCGCDRGSRPGQIGAVAPDFTVQDSERTVHLAALRGRLVVLNFWASYCAPCLDELPSLVAMQKRMGERVLVLAVSEDKSESEYRQFLRDHNISLFSVYDEQSTGNRLYSTTGIPESFVIDSSGVMRRRFIGPVDWLNPEVLDYLDKLSRGQPAERAAN